MGAINIPSVAGGGIKLVQRGEAVSSGNTTITAVNTAKTFVRSFSTGASGTVATNSSESGTLNASGGSNLQKVGFNSLPRNFTVGSFPTYDGTLTLSGGTTNATVKEFGIHLVNSTTITATGACRYEIVEFA